MTTNDNFFVRLIPKGVNIREGREARIIAAAGAEHGATDGLFDMEIVNGRNGIAGYTFSMGIGYRGETLHDGTAFASIVPANNGNSYIFDPDGNRVAEISGKIRAGKKINVEWYLPEGGTKTVPAYVFSEDEAKKFALLESPLELFYWNMGDILDDRDVNVDALTLEAAREIRYELTDLIGEEVGDVARDGFSERLEDLADTRPELFEGKSRKRNSPRA